MKRKKYWIVFLVGICLCMIALLAACKIGKDDDASSSSSKESSWSTADSSSTSSWSDENVDNNGWT